MTNNYDLAAILCMGGLEKKDQERIYYSADYRDKQMILVKPVCNNQIILADWTFRKLVNSIGSFGLQYVYDDEGNYFSVHPDIGSFVTFYDRHKLIQNSSYSSSSYYSLNKLYPNTFVNDASREYILRRFAEEKSGFFLDKENISYF